MMILSVLIVLFVLSMVHYIKDEFGCGDIMSVISGMLLFIYLLLIPIEYYSTIGKIKQFENVRSTIEIARQDTGNIENAALKLEILKLNAWLTGLNYWNDTVFDIFIPDEVETVEYLK